MELAAEKDTLRCRLFGHRFSAAHGLLDPSPELFDSCLRCRKPRVIPPAMTTP